MQDKTDSPVHLGFSQFTTLVMTCPPYLVACLTAMGVSISSGHFNERTWHLTSLKTLAAVGFALAAATLNSSVRYFAAFVFIIGTWGGTSITQSWIASTCAQTKEKRAVAIGLGNMSAASTLIWTPVGASWADSRVSSPLTGFAFSTSGPNRPRRDMHCR